MFILAVKGLGLIFGIGPKLALTILGMEHMVVISGHVGKHVVRIHHYIKGRVHVVRTTISKGDDNAV